MPLAYTFLAAYLLDLGAGGPARLAPSGAPRRAVPFSYWRNCALPDPGGAGGGPVLAGGKFLSWQVTRYKVYQP